MEQFSWNIYVLLAIFAAAWSLPWKRAGVAERAAFEMRYLALRDRRFESSRFRIDGENKKTKEKEHGFTLVELLIVIAIIGLLSSVVLLSVNSARLKARDAKRKFDLRQLNIAMEMFYSDNGDYPAGQDDTFGQGMDFDFVNGFIFQLAAGDYLPKDLTDPGGKLYWYIFENGHVNNIAMRKGACGDNPLPRAALLFQLEEGISNDYRIVLDSFGNPWFNAFCYF